MEYDIDFYKHFAWLKKVRQSPLACLLLIPLCTRIARQVMVVCFPPAVLLLYNIAVVDMVDNLGGAYAL